MISHKDAKEAWSRRETQGLSCFLPCRSSPCCIALAGQVYLSYYFLMHLFTPHRARS
jgi:hypothetical protein